MLSSRNKIVHPITLEFVTNTNYPFCPVNNEDSPIEPCMIPVNKNQISDKDLEYETIVPNLNFDIEKFIKIYYKIFTFEEMIQWLEVNKYKSLQTKLRVLNMALSCYGNTIDIIDSRLAEFIIEIIKKKYLLTMYYKLYGYINVTDDKVHFSDVISNKLDIEERMKERIQYMLTFVTTEEITKFTIKYIRNRKTELENIIDNVDAMITDFIIYFENKIRTTLKI